MAPFSPLISMPFCFGCRWHSGWLRSWPLRRRTCGRGRGSASSTSLLPIFPLAAAAPEAMPPLEPCEGISRSLMNVSASAPIDFGHLFAADEAGHVDDVRVEIAMRSGTRRRLLKPPDQRHIRPGPILKIIGANMIDPPESSRPVRTDRPAPPPARGDSCTRRTSCLLALRAASRICRASARLPASGFSHATFFPASSAAIAISACMLFGVPISTSPICGIVDRLLPIGRRMLPAPALGKFLQLRLIAADDRVHHRKHRQIEKLADLQICVAVSAAHELVADQADI